MHLIGHAHVNIFHLIKDQKSRNNTGKFSLTLVFIEFNFLEAFVLNILSYSVHSLIYFDFIKDMKKRKTVHSQWNTFCFVCLFLWSFRMLSLLM